AKGRRLPRQRRMRTGAGAGNGRRRSPKRRARITGASCSDLRSSSNHSARASRHSPPGDRTDNMVSVPVADAHIVRARLALAGFTERLEAHEEDRPLAAAVVHELHGLFPAFVPEENHGEVVFLLEIEADLRADPLLGAVFDLPHHALAGV